jgi:hypothetical protein
MNERSVLVLCAACALAFAAGNYSARKTGPVVIDLTRPGDALVVRLDGRTVGGLRADGHARLAVFGPNRTSSVITVDRSDRVQIDPAPVPDPRARLSIANDVWLTGALRVGRPDAFGDAPFDPNGAIQLGRNLGEAQPMALARFFAQGREAFRIGATREGYGFWSDGAHDTPLVTFRPSTSGSQTGGVAIYGAELLHERGTIWARHPETNRTVELVPR